MKKTNETKDEVIAKTMDNKTKDEANAETMNKEAKSKKTQDEANKEVNIETKSEKIKVLFANTYIGDLGVFYKNNYYFIDEDLSEKLKTDIIIGE